MSQKQQLPRNKHRLLTDNAADRSSATRDRWTQTPNPHTHPEQKGRRVQFITGRHRCLSAAGFTCKGPRSGVGKGSHPAWTAQTVVLLLLMMQGGVRANLRHDHLLDSLWILLHALDNILGAHVGGHDQDGVLEGHLAALAVGDMPIIQDLQQDVEHICMSLLNFIKQNDCIRPSPAIQ